MLSAASPYSGAVPVGIDKSWWNPMVRKLVSSYGALPILAAGFAWCACSAEYEELSLTRTRYEGDEIRLDGYWYNLIEDGELGFLYFLYRDGTLLNASCHFIEGEDPEETIRSSEWERGIRQARDCWGVFAVERGRISFERWYPFDGPERVYRDSGDILERERIHMDVYIRPSTGESRAADQLWYFREFAPKPDHANSFVK
jgi:hypothetical protein